MEPFKVKKNVEENLMVINWSISNSIYAYIINLPISAKDWMSFAAWY